MLVANMERIFGISKQFFAERLKFFDGEARRTEVLRFDLRQASSFGLGIFSLCIKLSYFSNAPTFGLYPTSLPLCPYIRLDFFH